MIKHIYGKKILDLNQIVESRALILDNVIWHTITNETEITVYTKI